MLKKVKLLFTVLLVVTGLMLTACGNKEEDSSDYDDYESWEEDDEERIQHDSEFEPSSYTGFEYASKVTKLGKTDGIEYTYSGSYEPSEAEIDEEMQYLKEDYEIDEFTDEVVSEVFGYDTVADLRESVKLDLAESMIGDEYDNAVDALFKAVIDSSEFDISDDEVQAEYESQMEGYEGMAEMFGYTVEELASEFWGQTVEELQEETRGFALDNVRIYAVVDAIIKDKKIDISADWKEYAEQIIFDYGYEDIWEFVDETQDERYLMSEIKYRAALNYLFEKGVNTAK